MSRSKESSRSIKEVDANQAPTLVVGIPAYNEEVAIGSVVLSAKRATDHVLVVDDGSTDATAEIAEEAGARVIRHETNKGKGAAVQTLLADAQSQEFDVLVLLDGDGQHIAEDISSVAKPVLQDESDVVIGSRYLEGETTETPLYRRLGQKALDLLTIGSSGATLSDTQSGFRALSPTAIKEMTIRTDGIGVESEMIDKATDNGLDIEEVPIEVRYNGVQGQTYNPLHHGLSVMVFVLQLIRDRHPLLFFGLPGVLLLGTGGGFVTNAAFLYHSNSSFHQWRFMFGGLLLLVGMVSLFSGLMLNQIANIVEKGRRDDG